MVGIKMGDGHNYQSAILSPFRYGTVLDLAATSNGVVDDQQATHATPGQPASGGHDPDTKLVVSLNPAKEQSDKGQPTHPHPQAKLSIHIDTDSRPLKRKSRNAAQDLDTSKCLRSTSVEPPPHSLASGSNGPAPASPGSESRPAEPVTENTPVAQPHKSLPNFHKNRRMDTEAPAAAVRLSEGVMTMPNGQQYTAPPPGGFPVPQCVESPWRNTSDRNRADWGAEPGPKGWVRVYRAKYNANARETVEKLRFVIPRLVDAPGVIISPPTAREELDERLPPPGTSRFPYIMTLQNFSCTDDEEANKFVAGTVQAKLKSIKEASEFLAKHSSETDAAAAAKAAADTIDSIHAKSLEIALPGGGKDVVWNIYCLPPPSIDFFNFLEWCSAARGLTYDTARFGTGVPRMARDQLFCVGCKSYDHPMGLCPYPRIVGWFGPSLNSLASDDKTLRAAEEQAEKKNPKGGKGGKPGHRSAKAMYRPKGGRRG
ncbi:hypothetical protein B0H15DRAFT_804968 [Mycena belliarum]|uniref:Uncharacterized protein n=1 Tax=Mycena belliarum TaxID=1033014 RepID=A0AAD6TXN7_9AGAR|nr:hypothetical protein B0H15DRAFT_804968 [Mycena belliae]